MGYTVNRSDLNIWRWAGSPTSACCIRPARPGADVFLDAARQAATGLQQLLAFRHDCTTVTTPAGQATATARLTSAAAELGKAAEALRGLIELAEITGRSGPTGKTDLN